ncbi:3-ketoacyl-ACP reductase [Bacillus sp. FSL W8-0445]|jgi:Short-chain dehydrogenases of various substrate specificities|uniref:Short-chain dehydrogenase/reductase SDR,Calcium-binding EF-hand n=4 Tax=Bacillus TaxID=1386 RepID=Q65IQ8_BACLD|nr:MULTISPECIES: 3-ketoacyl-ACP reductase [Bacillus]MBJ7887211.1 3-ketoacyl-ACP reductase [Bacillaceae bacterium HSR45]MDP4137304.1 3-ketoacyl-ACP reductase [Bacillota bacterium]AAU23694.1 Short-chain dehydrogenase/reductase SDR,Calcium-binding EF-hand [Bacillus licheniformis DSM 13 = ATCC 14580]AAU41056.1 putative glucose/ribitol dehydrogenase YoxD [Bacillus licheniformis DSM 13 = ATCC 14580]AKQ73343.1 3-ketoacyl-ACP reductase [Bacillus licheniformis WX-02]
MQSLQNKTALITGGGRGIGRATAIALAKEGVHIGLIGRTAANLEKAAEELKAFGVKVSVAAADVKDLTAVERAVQSVKEELGQIDILINNAGIGGFAGFLEQSPEEWENIIQVNLMGVYNVTRAVLPEMIERKAGDIINISSTAGQRGAAGTSAYSASKFAVLGLTESLMQEVRKHNIRVSALTPSTVATDLAIDSKLTDGNPERVMQPEDLAEYMVAQLKLHPRIFIKSAGMWSTNP